ncbi:MAG TPA: response regulator [Longimicrobium sp.]|nr:response regulator [Longimicrobium sp.]
MNSVVVAGLPGHFATWLAERLPGVTVQAAFSAAEAADHARNGRTLVLIDLSVGADDTMDALRGLRGGPGGTAPVVVTVEPDERGVDENVLDRLVKNFAVDRVLFHPLDRAELLRAVSALLRVAAGAMPTPAPAQRAEPAAAAGSSPPAPSPAAAQPPGQPAPPAPRQDVAAAVNQLWTRARGAMLQRVEVLERAARAAGDGRLNGALRQQATDEAHRLAGALGTFGVPEGTRLAREMETRFGGGQYLKAVDGAELATTAARLRRAIEQRPAEAPAPAAAPPARPAAPARARADGGAPVLLVVTTDPALATAARDAMTGGAVQIAVVAEVGEIEGALSSRPEVVLLDVSAADATSDWTALNAVGARYPGVPIVVATARGALPDRLRAVQLGASTFLQKPLSPGAVKQAVGDVLPARRAERARVLCVDDDPQQLDAARAFLEPHGLEVHTSSDPLHFWTRLGEVTPDLLVLDIDMPHVNGIELCRVVRADPRWRALPVVFLTARTEAETVYRVFAAGADDYVAKPFVGPELIARIRNQLSRTR